MLSVGVRIAALAQGAPLAITDVTVVDGTGDGSRPHMTVVVSGGRIIAVDPVARAVIPPQATVIDGRGKFLIPGLWDMHVHLAKAGASSPGLFVANGVTSVRDMGGDFAVVRRWRDEIAAGVRGADERNPYRIVYSSRPERGLEVLLGEVLPRILAEEPRATLHLATYDYPAADAQPYYRHVRTLAESFGDRVVQHGALAKRDL